MKKFISLVIVMGLCLTMCGCSSKNKEVNKIVEQIKEEVNDIKEEIEEVKEEIKEEVKETVKQEEPKKEETPAKQEQSSNSIRPEFKELMIAYEKFFDEYIEFISTYDGSLSQLVKYGEFMTKYADAMSKLEKIGEEELTDAELALYTDTMLGIEAKLLKAAQ